MLISRGAKENQALFKGKRFLPRVVTGKKCRLSNDVVKVYSFLAYKARDGRPVRPALIARRTGLERGRSGKRTGTARGVPRLLELLIAENLARKVEGGYEAIEPTGDRREWFGWKQGKDGEWHKTLATYKVYTIAPGVRRKAEGEAVRLTQSASDLYFLMASLAGWKGGLHGQTRTGLAVLLGVSRPTVAAGLALLQKLDLVNPKGHGFALGYPSVETLELWRDRKAATAGKGPRGGARPTTSEPMYDLAEIVRQSLEGRGRKDDIEVAIPAILAHRQTLANARYTDEDITKLLIGTLPLFPGLHEIWFYFQTGGFLDAFTRAEAEHRANAKRPGRPSVDLLIYKVREVARQVRC